MVGREPEYAMLREFLGPGLAAGAFALIGGPGIGKTTLWEAGIGGARECGWRVLCARPSGAETQMSFAALIDLLDGVETGALAVPAPQLAGLDRPCGMRSRWVFWHGDLHSGRDHESDAAQAARRIASASQARTADPMNGRIQPSHRVRRPGAALLALAAVLRLAPVA